MVEKIRKIEVGKWKLGILGLFLFSIFCFLSYSAHSAQAFSSEEDSLENSITVLASSSLSEAITSLAKIYSAKEGITVSAIFHSPEMLADSIVSGETADVYISENKGRFDDLKQRGILDVYSITDLASNQLVLIISNESGLERKLPKKAPLPSVIRSLLNRTLLVMGDPDSAALGDYTRRELEKYDIWEEVVPAIIRAEDSRNALYLISKGHGAGVVYYSDALSDPEVKIIADFPKSAENEDKIIYHAAVVAGENMGNARKFLEFLKSPEANKILEWHGFEGV